MVAHIFVVPSAGPAPLRAALRHRRRAGAGPAADPRCSEGLREAGGLSGTLRGAGGFCHQCGKLPPPNESRSALPHPGSPREFLKWVMNEYYLYVWQEEGSKFESPAPCMKTLHKVLLKQRICFQITQDQVIMSHSPLRMFRRFHDKCVLVSGQGPVLEIAKKYPGNLSVFKLAL